MKVSVARLKEWIPCDASLGKWGSGLLRNRNIVQQLPFQFSRALPRCKEKVTSRAKTVEQMDVAGIHFLLPVHFFLLIYSRLIAEDVSETLYVIFG